MNDNYRTTIYLPSALFSVIDRIALRFKDVYVAVRLPPYGPRTVVWHDVKY